MQAQRKILIVDDEKFVTDTLEGFFSHGGFKIFKAEDGEACLNIIKNEPLDLVLLDIKLPKVDGIEILKILRQDYPQVKVIVMTAYDMEYKNKIDSIGCEAFFLKPLLIDELTAKIEELLSGGKISVAMAQAVDKDTSFVAQKTPSDILGSVKPKTRILIVSPRVLISNLLKDYFTNKEAAQGIYEVSESGLEQLEYIKKFKPDIILLDVAFVGMIGEFGTTLMKIPQPPKEIILFGDPAASWEEIEMLVKRGMRFIETALDLHDRKHPIGEAILRLHNAVKDVCVKYALFK